MSTHTQKNVEVWQKNFRPVSRVKFSMQILTVFCLLEPPVGVLTCQECGNGLCLLLFPNFIDSFQYLAKNIEAWFKTRYVVQNVSRHLSYLALPVIRDHLQLGILSKGQTVTHCCEKQQIYESKF